MSDITLYPVTRKLLKILPVIRVESVEIERYFSFIYIHTWPRDNRRVARIKKIQAA